jgi:hypothetical protein
MIRVCRCSRSLGIGISHPSERPSPSKTIPRGARGRGLSRPRSTGDCRQGRGSRTSALPRAASRSATQHGRRARPLVRRPHRVRRSRDTGSRTLGGMAAVFGTPVDNRNDYLSAVEVDAAGHRVVRVEPEQLLVEHPGVVDPRGRDRDAKYSHLESLSPSAAAPLGNGTRPQPVIARARRTSLMVSSSRGSVEGDR